jgi:hypothetical protein
VDEIAFLFDVANTLLDNDRVQDDLKDHLEREFGTGSCDRYRSIFEEQRQELGYADYLGALQRYRAALHNDPRLLLMACVPGRLPVRGASIRRCAGRDRPCAPMGTDDHRVGRRCRSPAPEGAALGVMESGRRARADLHPQGNRCSKTSSDAIPRSTTS